MTETKFPADFGPPKISDQEVRYIVKKVFGLTVLKLKKLISYDDVNYHVIVCEKHENPFIKTLWSHGYVLKILNAQDSAKTSFQDFSDGQVAMILHLRKHGYNCQDVVKNVTGTYHTSHVLTLEENEAKKTYGPYNVKLLTFLPGIRLIEVDYKPDLLYQVGQWLGTLHVYLQDFTHAGYDRHSQLWSLGYVPKLVAKLDAIQDEDNRKLATDVINTFAKDVPAKYRLMQKGYIHGDFNEHNILVEETSSSNDHIKKYQVSGLLDFGDSDRSYTVFDIGICIMYMMTECTTMDTNLVGGHVLAGYLSKCNLNDHEWDVLKVCVAARFAQSMTIGAYSYMKNPENEYLLQTGIRGWKVLKHFWEMQKTDIYEMWNDVIEAYNNN